MEDTSNDDDMSNNNTIINITQLLIPLFKAFLHRQKQLYSQVLASLESNLSETSLPDIFPTWSEEIPDSVLQQRLSQIQQDNDQTDTYEQQQQQTIISRLQQEFLDYLLRPVPPNELRTTQLKQEVNINRQESAVSSNSFMDAVESGSEPIPSLRNNVTSAINQTTASRNEETGTEQPQTDDIELSDNIDDDEEFFGMDLDSNTSKIHHHKRKSRRISSDSSTSSPRSHTHSRTTSITTTTTTSGITEMIPITGNTENTGMKIAPVSVYSSSVPMNIPIHHSRPVPTAPGTHQHPQPEESIPVIKNDGLEEINEENDNTGFIAPHVILDQEAEAENKNPDRLVVGSSLRRRFSRV